MTPSKAEVLRIAKIHDNHTRAGELIDDDAYEGKLHRDTAAMLRAYADTFGWLETCDHWPKLYERVLVELPSGRVTIMVYVGNGLFRVDQGDIDFVPLHWQPLPASTVNFDALNPTTGAPK